MKYSKFKIFKYKSSNLKKVQALPIITGLILTFNSISIFFLGGGCSTSIRGYAFVNHYCVGNHGILLTGPQANSTSSSYQPGCCTYDSNAGVIGTTSNTGLSGVTADNININFLHGQPTSNPTPNASMPCPSSLDVTPQLLVGANNATNNTNSTLAAVQSLASSGQTTLNGNGSSSGSNGSSSNGNASGNTNSQNAGYAGATAGGTMPSRQTPGNNATAGGTTATPQPLIPSSGGGGGGGFLSDAMSSLFGGSDTSKNNSASNIGSGKNTNDPNTAAASYASGGGGGGSGGNGGGRSSNEVDGSKIDWGLGNGATAGGKVTGSRDLASDTQVETNDPANYFDRIKSTENLFKKVEEKYKEKSPLLQI